MSKINATEIRSGTLIEVDKRLWKVIKSRHVHVGGRGGAYMQVEVKDVENDNKNSFRLRTDEKVDRPFLESHSMLYLYSDDGGHVLMDNESFEQITLPADFFEGGEKFLLPDMVLEVNFYNDRVIAAELPLSVVMEVTYTEPQIKGATASSSYKPATVQTGLSVQVPPFINIGEKIKISTATGEYLEKA